MKRLKKHIISLIIVSLLVIFVVLKKDFNQIISVLLNANFKYIFIGVLIVLLGDLLKALSVSSIIKKFKNNYKFKDGFLLILKTNFFNGVTPFCLGGQPFQLYSLKKTSNINYITGVNIVFKDFYSYQMALVIMSTICLITNYLFNIIIFTSIIKKLIILGYIINFIIAIVLIYIPYSKNNANEIVKVTVLILNKLKLIKDKDTTINNINKSIVDLKYQIKNTLKDKNLIIWCILLNMLKISMLGVAAYFCFKSVGLQISILLSIIVTIMIITMASFVPIPGGSGGMEYGFITLFAPFVIDIKLSAVLLIWRFLTYYMMIFVGFFFVLFESKGDRTCG